MRNKVFSFALGTLACMFLALPAAAQGGGSSGSGLDGIFQGLYQEIASWFGLTTDETEMGGAGMPGGLMATGDSSEMSPIIFPGGLTTTSGSANLTPYNPIGGNANLGESPEAAPYIAPGG